MLGELNPTVLEWNSLCLSYNAENSSASYTLNGENKEIHLGSASQEKKLMLTGGGEFILGQDQDIFGGEFDPYQSLSAYIADFKIFDRLLQQDTMIEWTDGTSNFSGPSLISFDSFQTFDTCGSVRVVKESYNHECFKSTVPFYAFIEQETSFHQASLICNGFGGSIAAPTSEEENNELFDVVSTSPICELNSFLLDIVWLGYVRETPGNEWVNYRSGVKVNYTNFRFSESLAELDSDANCVSFMGCKTVSGQWQKIWSQHSCSEQRYSVCYFKEFPLVKVRGLCKHSKFDKLYYLDQTSSRFHFVGLYNTLIQLSMEEKDKKVWIMKNMYGGKTLATTVLKSHVEYPLGKYLWNITGDSCPGFQNEKYLVITSCKENQFTCDDGSCIPLSRRCDSRIHCFDGSDEEECTIIFPTTANISILPPPKLKQEKNVCIHVRVIFKRILELDLRSFILHSEIILSLTWKDPRLQFANLRNSIAMNQINLSDRNRIWLPDFELLGDNFSYSEIDPINNKLLVKRTSDPLPDDLSRITEGELLLCT